MNGLFSRHNQLSGLYRQFLCSRLAVLSIDKKGAKQTTEENINLPLKPKKPLTPYFRFMQQVRPVVVENNPALSATDVLRTVSKKWENADDKLKKDLVKEYKAEMEIYSKDILKYQTSLTDKQKEFIKQIKIEKNEAKQKRKLKQKAKELNRPKRPSSSYVLYATSRMGARGNTPVKDWQQQIAKEWEVMDKGKKDQFIEEAKRNMDKYSRELKEWEDEMVKAGHVDIVRSESLTRKTKSKLKK